MPSHFPFSYPTSFFNSYLANFISYLPEGIDELDWLDQGHEQRSREHIYVQGILMTRERLKIGASEIHFICTENESLKPVIAFLTPFFLPYHCTKTVIMR